MDCDNDENRKENNFDYPTNTTTKRISCSILKMNEFEKRNSFDEIEDLGAKKSKRRKSRVSFSANVQIKTIDESLDQHHPSHTKSINNESITAVNTALNAMTKTLVDISNVDMSTSMLTTTTVGVTCEKNNKRSVNSTYLSNLVCKESSNDVNYEQESMDMGNNTTMAFFDEESCLQKTMNINNTCIDYSYLPQVGQTFMNMTVKEDETMTEPQTDNINNETKTDDRNLIQEEMSIMKHKNMTYDIIEQTNLTTNKSELINQPSETGKKPIMNSTYGVLKSEPSSELTNNEIDVSLGTTITINDLNNLTSVISAKNANNETKVISSNNHCEKEPKENEIVEATPIIAVQDIHPKQLDFGRSSEQVQKKTIHPSVSIPEPSSVPTNLNSTTTKETTLTGLRDYFNRSNLNNISTHLNNTIDLSSISFLEIPKAQTFSLNGTSLENIQSFGEALKDHLESELVKMKNLKTKLKECEKIMHNKHEESLSNKKKAEFESIELSRKLAEIKEKANILKLNSAKTKESVRYFNYEQERYEKLQTDLKTILSKNKNIEKETNELTNKRNNLKEKIENQMDKLKNTRELRNDKEKFKNLCEKLFNSKTLMYKMEINEDIILSYFFDLIKLEIKASNIISDMNNDMNAHMKFLNYPLTNLYFRSTLDAYGLADYCFSNKTGSKNNKMPMYLRYCINLILGDIGEGDLMVLNKKYKYVKDLPMLITYVNVVCKFATNLAEDFEYLIGKTQDSKIKFDFDLKNNTVSIILPSTEDCCYYRIKLKILPGRYYQEAIAFTIDQADMNEFFEPNLERIKKNIEGHYFENGSLRNYLKRLNFNI